MATTGKKTVRKTTSKKGKKIILSGAKVVVNKNMKDHSNAPFFVKKAKEMETALRKHGLPSGMVHA